MDVQALLAQYLPLFMSELLGFCAADCPPQRGNAAVAKATQFFRKESTGANRERSVTLPRSNTKHDSIDAPWQRCADKSLNRNSRHGFERGNAAIRRGRCEVVSTIPGIGTEPLVARRFSPHSR